MKEFYDLLRHEAKQLNMEFERSKLQGKGTPQEVSDFREHAVQNFIKKYFPFPYKISKGGINDSFGKKSHSIDCLILNPNHPHTVDSLDKHTLIFADGVDAAIEVKPDVSIKSELMIALKQGVSVKKLRQVESPLSSRSSPYRIELSKTIPFFIFAEKMKAKTINTLKEILEYYYLENDIPLEEQIDGLVVNNRGILMNYKYGENIPWESTFRDSEDGGWLFEQWGEDALGGFLFHLNRVSPAVVPIQTPVISHYARKSEMKVSEFKRIRPQKE